MTMCEQTILYSWIVFYYFMDILNNWTIVVGVGAIVTLILHWSKQAYFDPVINREEDTKRKVKEDLTKKLSKYKEIIDEKGEEQFTDEIRDIIEFRKNLRDLKETFNGKMIPFGIGLCLLSVVLVSIWGYNFVLSFIIGYVVFIVLVLVIAFFFKIKTYENQFSKYLDGENPTKILNEKKN